MDHRENYFRVRALGLGRSGRKARYMGALCSMSVLTLVGCTAFIRMENGPAPGQSR
ncbi:hypothetical protein BZL30_5117 [Mycobacterium kansasii]|uniref:Uncharacterized protein n=1 Tax=Mycobacterium kansasii TaxID=1768 RepID=A0A1V3X4S8_MYCKA|nr:hypothetical protein BZL30_5117 [Mycobacterium kansasii]